MNYYIRQQSFKLTPAEVKCLKIFVWDSNVDI